MTKPSATGGLFFARRVVVVGANGAGKTWLATRVAAQLDLPVVHNDALALQTHWVQRPRAEVRANRDQIAKGDLWVIEGGPSILSGAVLARAEVIIWLDIPRCRRLARVIWRSLRYLGQQRPEHPTGNRDWPGMRQMRFLRKTWTGDAAMRAAIRSGLDDYAGQVIHLTQPSQIDELRRTSAQANHTLA